MVHAFGSTDTAFLFGLLRISIKMSVLLLMHMLLLRLLLLILFVVMLLVLVSLLLLLLRQVLKHGLKFNHCEKWTMKNGSVALN